MKKLINIQKTTIGTAEVNAVSARELYLGLGYGKGDWSRWSLLNIEKNEFFLQDIDFVRNSTKLNPTNGVAIDDFYVSIEFAKHISMMAKTAKGHEYRSYFLELEKQPLKMAQLPSFADAVAGVEAVANYLRLSESGRIAFIAPVIKQYGVAIELPAYAIDKPSTSIVGSSMPTNSATALLKERKMGMSALALNKVLESNGIIETLTRKSTKGGKPINKKYKSVSVTGMEYGKNVTSPSSPKETQPHWYVHKFGELLDLTGLA